MKYAFETTGEDVGRQANRGNKGYGVRRARRIGGKGGGWVCGEWCCLGGMMGVWLVKRLFGML